jgi:hypothetical protein
MGYPVDVHAALLDFLCMGFKEGIIQRKTRICLPDTSHLSQRVWCFKSLSASARLLRRRFVGFPSMAEKNRGTEAPDFNENAEGDKKCLFWIFTNLKKTRMIFKRG